MEFHKRFYDLRIKNTLSQEEPAAKCYVSRQTISSWERGKTYPDIHSLLLIATIFDVSLDYLIKGDVAIMKHQVSRTKLRNWLILSGILFFVFYPTRYLLDSNIFSILLSVIGMPLLYCFFQVFHILANKKINTFTDILIFLDAKEHPFKLSREIWWTFVLLIAIFAIFFLGTVVSALIFW